ncbi:hypothetical protein C1645_737907 [Glomus cerebriforme]|uniref:BTB domain-containing protein n=1 Tax=Glomus cerebriforme TaxID=658196 RepID=A0A397T5C9_9GLOM|nr:hypothetical protein C1645_737907 [Glomus cerebriforme]
MVENNKLLPKLSQNLLEILNDDEYYDITIEVDKDPYIEVFRAYMVILHYRSSYLKRMLSINKKKNDGTLAQIKLPNILPEIFQIILRYIYGGNLSLEEYNTPYIIKILDASSELNLQEFVTHLQSFLIKNKANWIEENFDLIYQKSFKNDSFLELQKYCTNLISEEPDKIFKLPNFSSIPEKLLLSVIQNDNLQMDEIQIWKRVKWGHEQNPEFPSELTNYSKDDFKTLRNTLKQCIPFIRFYNLTSKEFIDKVLPYRNVLPKELYEELLITFLKLSDPDSKPINKSNSRSRKEINLKPYKSYLPQNYLPGAREIIGRSEIFGNGHEIFRRGRGISGSGEKEVEEDVEVFHESYSSYLSLDEADDNERFDY